ncbi:LuxR C-terminal-related transcriptional regulator [Planosporangium sp. 12N6]|uniref:helix-turn-helix domain-containing protein n=1 Tax=Planosporangium spinosum TaxID=3402278 RepID=UPI003CF79F4A
MGSALPSLVRWGLSPDADLVYRTLVSLDTARESQLAHELGMAHERVREAMRELAHAGAIRRVTSPSRRAPKTTGRAVWAARQPNQVVRLLHGHRTRPLGPPALRGRAAEPSAPPPRTPRAMDPATTPSPPPPEPAPPTAQVHLGPPCPRPGGPDRPGSDSRRWIPHQPTPPMLETLNGGQHEDAPPIALTPRERAIVELLAQGHTDETAARELDLSRRTVGYALGGLMSRLGVDNRFQLGLALGAMRAATPVPRNRT